MLEPTIAAGRSFIKPDLLFLRDGELVVADVTVAQDGAEQSAATAKLEKYGTGPAAEALSRYASTRGASFRGRSSVYPLVFSNRGFVFPATASTLKSWGLSPIDISHAVMTVVQGSLRCHGAYHRSTHQSVL